MSEISASYNNQNKELGSIGLTNIDNDKIHSSIITDDAGQKFIKVQIDGEYYYQVDDKYYYGDSFKRKYGFNVKIPINNAPDALSATKDWSWYILNNSDEAKTESTIKNPSQSNNSPVTVDGNTLSVGGTGTWQIRVAEGFTSSTETQGNLNGGPGLASTQDDHHQDPTHFNIYDSIINATNDAKSDLVSVTNLPSIQDGTSQFNVHMTGKASLINVMTGQTYDATITYSYGTGDNNFITGDQVTDWSKVKSIKFVPNGGAPSMTSLRLIIPVEDKTIYDDVGKTIYVSTMTYGEDKTNTNYTTKDGFAVPKKSTILPSIIKAGDKASAKLTVQGQATVHTLIHYKDANGKDVYVKLADKDKTYKELQDTMKRSNYLQSDSDLTIADRGLLPVGMIINYNNPTIRNSNNTYVAGYDNNAAAFDKMVKYDFDGDQVIFEGAMPEIVTKTHQAKETIHYIYSDGRTAAPDKVLTSITLKQTGSKNPFTGEITWNTPATDALNSVDSPEITGYIADKLTVPSYVVTMTSPDKEVTVTYDADNENADFTYFDDTKNSPLKVVNKSGKSNTSIGYTTTDEINNYEKQGYTLVSDDTNGRNLNFDSLPAVDQHYMIHLKHKTENVTRNDTVTRTIHYLYDNGNTAKPDKTQTVSFNETGTKDDVTGKTTWSNDNAKSVDSVNTPNIVGYTPNKSSIEDQSFKFGDQDVEVTVTYNANAQTAKIIYIDDTTKNNLDSKDASGKFGQAITFTTTPTDEIANYKKQGYKLVSNDFNDNKYQADNNKNVFYVHFVHDTKKVSRNDDINMTVHYVMDDGSVAPSDSKQTVNFTENGIQDLVTQKITWTPAVSQTFKDVATKSIVGYTPDKENVAGQTVNFGDNDINVTVHYSANTQKAKITYIDDTTKTDLDSKETSGKFGQAITFATAPADEIENYKKQGYVLVSSTFDNNKYQADDSSNVFYVHLKHDTKNVSRNSNVNMTVHYVMDDNSEVPSDNKQTVNFTENGIQDLVTKHIDWTPAVSQTFKDVATKSIVGYTPDKENVAGQTVNFGDKDINVIVHYSANTQTATITYIDDTEKKTLSSDNQNGKFNQTITFEHDPAEVIKGFEEKGYVFVSNTFDNNKYQADNSNNVFEVHLKHGTKNVSRNSNVNMTVHYVMDDNSDAPSDNKQVVNFTENGIQDLVTKHIDWTPAVSQTLKDVDSPVLTGYTADIKTANGKVVNFGDDDINVTVHYSANTQTATITYIDDTEKKTLNSDNQNGKFNQVIAFEHDPAEVIKGLEEKGYVFVSNTFDNQKYQADNSNNVFEVHFVHGTKDVSRSDDVNMTVHYVMDDNSEAPSDNKQAVSFTENGTQDLVTKDITWTPADSKTFKDVVTPKIAGYTPDQDKVAGQTVKFGDNDAEVTVTYSPNVQLGHINYIDDNTGKTLTRDDFSGRTNEHEDYTSIDRIQEFENKGYELVSNDYPDGGFNFDNNDRQDQVFNVHLKHGTVTVTTENPQTPNTPINPDPQSPKYPKDISNTNSDVKRTIDYKFKDGKTAQPTVNDSLHFERTVVIDKVTGKVSSDTWTPSQDFNDIQTPAIQGYTPDKAVVSDKNIDHDHQDIIEHVVYSPDKQHMTITYIDDTTGKTLHTDNPEGVSDQDAKYTTRKTIKTYEENHYKLVSDSTNGKDLIFDHDDNVNQTYEVHFVHGKHAINQTTSPKQTIHYVYADGLARQGKAADDNVQQLSFKRDGYNDEVTGTDHWNAWTPANSQYEAVDSPVIQGYTPDKLSVDGSTVDPTDKDIEITVTYNANKQKATITYIDDTTNTKLDSKDASGKFGQTITFVTTPADEIENYKKKGYVLASNNFDNQTYQAVDSNNVFEVHLKHGTVTVTTNNPQTPDTPINPDSQSPKYPKDINNTNKDVKRTIDYKFKDGKTAQPTVNDSLHFERTVVIDKVTGDVVSDIWTPSQDFNDIQTPAIQGYTSDRAVVSDKNIGHDHQDIVEHVVYSPDVQHMTITYIDDTTGETLHTDNPNGVSDQDANYTTGNIIKQFEEKHYKLVSDSTKGQDLIFDHDDNANQIYEVHFVHNTHAINQTTSPKQTIHYVYADGLASQGKVTDDNVQQLSFKRDGYNDEVTGIDHWNAWTPANSQYEAVDSPVIQGYTPNKSVIEKSIVNPTDKNIEITVTYNADKQVAHVIYFDKTANTTLDSKDLSGKSDKDSEYSTAAKIGKYKSQHYVLFEDETNGENVIFDHNDKQDQTYYVYLVHDTQKVSREHSASFTVHYIYKDGRQAKPDHEQALSFTENGIQDLVTQKITWTPADSQKFDDVVTPVITGYTPDQDKVAGQTANFETGDRKVTVTYLPDVQLGHINYIDDNTGKTLTRDNFSGRTNEHEDYTPIDRIQEFENKGYELVSNDYPDGGFNFDDNDQQDQVFNVHLKHGTTTVTPDNPGHPGEPVDPKNPEGPKYPNGTELDQVKRTGTQTIHYVGAGDKTPADNKQTFEFTREITFDNVTGKIIKVTSWNVESHTFGNVDTPVIPGYHADKAVAGGATVTPDDLNKVIIVTYAPNGGSGDNPGSNGGGDQGTTSTPEPVPEPTPSPDDQPDTTLPSDNNTNKDVEKDKQDKPEEVKKARKIIKTRITKQEHIGNAEKAEHLTEQKHNDQTVVSPVKNEANEPQLPQTGEANTSVIGLLGMLVAGFAEILGFESSRSRKHKN
ncbi:mucin-binding protein [Lactobacillus crispatus]